MVTPKPRFRVLVLATLACAAGCAQIVPLPPEGDGLARERGRCLSQGVKAYTPAMAECISDLYAERQSYLALLPRQEPRPAPEAQTFQITSD